MIRKFLLGCGIGSSLLYVGMNVVAALRYPGYDPLSYTVSELSAIGAPTRPLWLPLAMGYEAFVIAFGTGVWMSAGRKRSLQVVAALLVAYGNFNFYWPPMHQREVIAAGGETATDTLHLVWAGVAVLFIFLFIATGAVAFGKRFRLYSLGTILLMLLFGLLTFPASGGIARGQPTPLAGLWERVNIFMYLQWIVALAILLLRSQTAASDPVAEPSTFTGQVVHREPVREELARR